MVSDAAVAESKLSAQAETTPAGSVPVDEVLLAELAVLLLEDAEPDDDVLEAAELDELLADEALDADAL